MKLKRWIILAMSAILSCGALLGGCAPDAGESNGGAKKFLETYDPKVTNGVAYDAAGKPTFSYHGMPSVFWGMEVNIWDASSGNRNSFDKYVKALKEVGANTIGLYFAWSQFEPNEGDFRLGENSYAQYCIDEAKKNDLKMIIYVVTSNYASGDSNMTPDWIINDKERFSRTLVKNGTDNVNPGEVIEGTRADGTTYSSDCGDDVLNLNKPEKTLCANDPDLREVEERAVREIFKFIGKNNEDDSVLGINIYSEFDYSRTWATDQTVANHNYRCYCENCNKLFRQEEGYENETNLEFMQRKYNNYVRDMIYAGLEEYSDVAVFVPVAGLFEFPLGRYVEQPQDLYPLIDRDNVFVCPSVGAFGSEEIVKTEMDKFTGKAEGYESLVGNPAFCSGAAPEWVSAPHYHNRVIDFAPWMYFTYYGGIGALYWDHPGEEFSVLTSDAYRTRYKNSWTVLKAMDYYIGIFKNSPEYMNFWSYNTQHAEYQMGNFKVTVNRDDPDEYLDYQNFGVALLYGDNDMVFGATQHSSDFANEIRLELNGGSLKGYKIEYGMFDSKGNWVKYSSGETINEKTAVIDLNRGDERGKTESALVRVYKG